MKHKDLLIVDDEHRYADMLAKRLRLRGCTCSVCYNGRDAIRALEEATFMLVVLDLQLPDLYGTEVLKQIKAIRAELPVVILTGHGTETDRQECLRQGAFAFIHKPLDIDKLVEIWKQIKGGMSLVEIWTRIKGEME